MYDRCHIVGYLVDVLEKAPAEAGDESVSRLTSHEGGHAPVGMATGLEPTGSAPDWKA